MTKPGHTGLKRVAMATRYTIKGLRAAWRHEAAFRQECVVAALLAPLAFLFGTTATQIVVLIGVLLLVLIVELLNSAIEAVVDLMTLEPHPLAGRAKDLGSAAVGLAIMLAGLAWGLAALGWLLGR
jgi:diacylglycerol kinase (ATP)